MNLSENVIICGDIHANWAELNKLINIKRPDIILQCGDFGYWPNFEKYDINKIKSKNTKIYWCDGNHENHWELKKLRKKGVVEVVPNVFYMKRGSVFTLPDAKNVLFVGGADSIDKRMRTVGRDWFPEEIINQSDVYNLPDLKIDVIISHTCPEFLNKSLDDGYGFNGKFMDPSQVALNYVWEKYKPNLWYFGHFHVYRIIEKHNTKFTALGYAGSSQRWWIYYG